jgi:hypothetical protein
MSRLLWTLKQDLGPSARMLQVTTYDSARARTVLLVGESEPQRHWRMTLGSGMDRTGPSCMTSAQAPG